MATRRMRAARPGSPVSASRPGPRRSVHGDSARPAEQARSGATHAWAATTQSIAGLASEAAGRRLVGEQFDHRQGGRPQDPGVDPVPRRHDAHLVALRT